MATRQALQGAFGRIADTLRTGSDPSAPDEVQARWLGVTIRHAATARREAWLEIAAECDLYAPLIEQLDTIAEALESATDPDRVLATLELADMAIKLVGEVLDTDPCGAGAPDTEA